MTCSDWLGLFSGSPLELRVEGQLGLSHGSSLKRRWVGELREKREWWASDHLRPVESLQGQPELPHLASAITPFPKSEPESSQNTVKGKNTWEHSYSCLQTKSGP